MKPILFALLAFAALTACNHIPDACDVTDPAWARELGCYNDVGGR